MRHLFAVQAALFVICASAFGAGEDDARFARALGLFKAQDYAESAKLLDELATEDPGKALVWFNLGGALLKLEQFEDAGHAYKKVIELKSPLADAARFYQAAAQIRLGKPELAKKALTELRAKSLPPNLSAAVRAALSELAHGQVGESPATQAAMQAYKAKDYPKALTELDNALKAGPSGNIYFLKGLTLLRLQDPQGAKRAFEQASVATDLSPDLREDSRDFLRQIREGTWNAEKPFAVSADFWVDYNSNFFANGASEVSEGAAGIHGAATLRYRLFQRESLGGTLQYHPQWDEIVAYSDFRQISNLVRLQFSASLGTWFFSVSPELQYGILGTSPYLFASGITARAEKTWDPYLFGASVLLQRNSGLGDNFSYLSGNVFTVRAYWSCFTSKAEYWAYVSGTSESIGDLTFDGGDVLPLANRTFGGGVGVTLFPAASVETLFSASYFRKSFSTLSQPGDIERSDGLLSGAATVSYRLTPRFKPYASASFNWNSSTLDAAAVSDLNYRQWILSAGLTWDALP